MEVKSICPGLFQQLPGSRPTSGWTGVLRRRPVDAHPPQGLPGKCSPSSHGSQPFTGSVACAVRTPSPSAWCAAFSVPFIVSGGMWFAHHPSPCPQRSCPVSTGSWGGSRDRPESSFCHHLLPLEEVRWQASRAGHKELRRHAGHDGWAAYTELTPRLWRLEVWDWVSAWLGSGEGPLPLCRRPASPCVLTWWREAERLCSQQRQEFQETSEFSSLRRQKVILGGKTGGVFSADLFCSFYII